MNTNHARRNVGRMRTTVLVALAMVLSTMGLIIPGVARAVTLGALTTRMEIDGNKANAAGYDWNDIQDGTLPGGYVISPGVVSAGVVAQTYQIDGPSITQSCGVQDADSLVDGSKLDDNPWPVQPGLRTRRTTSARAAQHSRRSTSTAPSTTCSTSTTPAPRAPPVTSPS